MMTHSFITELADRPRVRLGSFTLFSARPWRVVRN